jgi:hypothetical protein
MAKNSLKNKAAEQSKDEASNEKKKKKSKRSFVKVLNGDFLSRDELVANLPFVFFVGFLLVLLIGWGYYTETVGKAEADLEKDLGELNSEYFTLGSEYNRLSRQSQVAERLKETGLNESVSPPKKIKIKKYVFD